MTNTVNGNHKTVNNNGKTVNVDYKIEKKGGENIPSKFESYLNGVYGDEWPLSIFKEIYKQFKKPKDKKIEDLNLRELKSLRVLSVYKEDYIKAATYRDRIKILTNKQ